jgi:hypothetical protein
MSSVSAIRDAIKTTLDTALDGVYPYDFVPDNASLPAIAVAPVLSDFEVAFGRGVDTWEFELLILTSRASDRGGQERLDQLITGAGSSSIRQVIFQNRTLGLSDCDAHVSGLVGYGPADAAGVDVYSARLRLVVTTSGTS